MTKIVEEIYENTGGGCMVYYMRIEDGGSLKMIGINEECVAGEDYWYTDNEAVRGESLWVEYYDINNLGVLIEALLVDQFMPKHIVDKIIEVIKQVIWKDYSCE